MTVTNLSIVVSPGEGDTFNACVKHLTDDAIDTVELCTITVNEHEAEREFPNSAPYAASMAWAAREAARRSGYTGRLAGAYAGHDFVFVALDGRF